MKQTITVMYNGNRSIIVTIEKESGEVETQSFTMLKFIVAKIKQVNTKDTSILLDLNQRENDRLKFLLGQAGITNVSTSND